MALTHIDNPILHRHVLLLKCAEAPFRCEGCQEIGFNRCYRCKKCNFYLHEECADPSRSSRHRFFQNCLLKFHWNARQKGERYCNACGKDVLGFMYQCTHGGPHYFHPYCLKLPGTLTDENGKTLHLTKKLPSGSGCLKCESREILKEIKSWCYVYSGSEKWYHVACVKDIYLENWKQAYFGLADMALTKIRNPNLHRHDLLLKRAEVPFKCKGCKELGFDLCYECKKCNFYLHEECADPSRSSRHRFFQNCLLKFHWEARQKGERYCNACGKDVLGFMYQCTHGGPHYFHPYCLKLPGTLTDENGKTLHLTKKLPSGSGCLKCESREILKEIKSWYYVYSGSEKWYHVACVKDIYLENWKQAYFGLAGGNANKMNHLALRSQEVGLPRVERRGTAKRTLKKAIIAIRLILCALFGDPTALISIVVGTVSS